MPGADLSPTPPWRILTATVLFDGHDAAINMIRRLLQGRGCEVIHLGFNRSVADVVQAAIDEDVDAIALSSYQGGHQHYLQYLLDELRRHDAADIQVFAGGGGTIGHDEARALEAAGINRIYHSDDGEKMGLDGLIDNLLSRLKKARGNCKTQKNSTARMITAIENEVEITQNSPKIKNSFVLGITGTGGAGKSTFIDELLSALLAIYPTLYIAYLAIDPSQPKNGGALLGDRIRINTLPHTRLFMRSIATRKNNISVPTCLPNIINTLKNNYELIIIETAGIGQNDISITDFVDYSLYIMNKEYGAATQLEKIAMLQYADQVILNKADQVGSEDALAQINKQLTYQHGKKSHSAFAMTASHYRDSGFLIFLSAFIKQLPFEPKKAALESYKPEENSTVSFKPQMTLQKPHYLADICQQYQQRQTQQLEQLKSVSTLDALYQSLKLLHKDDELPAFLCPITNTSNQSKALINFYNDGLKKLSPETVDLLQSQNKNIETYTRSLSGLKIPHIAQAPFKNSAEKLRFLQQENYPGFYPFTAGVFTQRHADEEATRMFAGFGTPEDTNKRFHLLIRGQKSIRLSTAFDPNTLYGVDPAPEPDVYACIGMSGVSIACIDDMKKLYSGIHLCDEHTSVSMTINGPAAIFMAWLLLTAIDQEIEIQLKQRKLWPEAEKSINKLLAKNNHPQAQYQGKLPPKHNGLGLALFGIDGKTLLAAMDKESLYQEIQQHCYSHLRGTLQADILKEEISQNECLFALDFSLTLMADLQCYFVEHNIKRFYSVSVSGYHIAEAGANPVTQLAFTLANGFTLVEYFLARGLTIDQIAPQLSFFFSNGMDAEYAVIGRVARRIWAQTMKEVYQASCKSQKLKYHIQTSGRSLQAKAIDLNDIRTSLQALYAIYDNCNSLHTNAYDEAVTTPTEASVYRALSIQMIINHELGLNKNQNPLQGSFIIEDLSDQLEQAVYGELQKLADRGGVIPSIQQGYQRLQIQQQSLHMEQLKNQGDYPLIGVNLFTQPKQKTNLHNQHDIMRCSQAKKQQRLADIKAFKQQHQECQSERLQQFKQDIKTGENSFAALMKVAAKMTLSDISQALCQLGGQYRRNM
ncbi:MAG: cobalamin B12-binding domain-containing protein [Pseudomonadales bacterium]|nr:cobalamin B12-binding domain-containing protein [Pseudomonadales bacterium]